MFLNIPNISVGETIDIVTDKHGVVKFTSLGDKGHIILNRFISVGDKLCMICNCKHNPDITDVFISVTLEKGMFKIESYIVVNLADDNTILLKKIIDLSYSARGTKEDLNLFKSMVMEAFTKFQHPDQDITSYVKDVMNEFHSMYRLCNN